MIILKIILMSVILVGMVVLLLSVKALGHPSFTADDPETEAMRKDVEQNDSPITSHSVFSNFLARDRRVHSK